jgi:ATP-dependent DNA helicase RecQ
LYGAKDFVFWRKTQEELPDEAKGPARRTLQGIENYCQGTVCRHRALVEYFGQQLESDDCGACDVCLSDLDLTPDAKIVAQKILSCVVRVNESFGAQYVAQVLCGSKEQRLLDNRHDQLSTYRLLADHGTSAVRSWIEQLVGQGYLERYGDYQQIRVTPAGWTVLKGNAVPRLLQPPAKKARPAKTSRSGEVSWEGVDSGLFEVLRQLRRELAAARNVSAYIVFGDESLRDMARRRPTSLELFRQIYGVGDRKADDYGERFLAAIRDYCRTNALSMNLAAQPRPATPVAQPSENTSLARRRSFDLFAENRSIEEAGQLNDRALSTTTQYLVEYINQSGRLEPQPWVDPETAVRIEESLRSQPDGRLKPVFDALEGSVSYDAIRIVAACLRNRPPSSADNQTAD